MRQEYFLDLGTAGRYGEARARSGTGPSIDATPTEVGSQRISQSVRRADIIHGRDPEDGIGRCDPKIGPRYPRVPVRVQVVQLRPGRPYRAQSQIINVREVDAAVGTEFLGGLSSIAIVIHEVVRGETHDPAQEVRAHFNVDDVVPESPYVGFDRIVRGGGETAVARRRGGDRFARWLTRRSARGFTRGTPLMLTAILTAGTAMFGRCTAPL